MNNVDEIGNDFHHRLMKIKEFAEELDVDFSVIDFGLYSSVAMGLTEDDDLDHEMGGEKDRFVSEIYILDKKT
jgi:hypothetical protein